MFLLRFSFTRGERGGKNLFIPDYFKGMSFHSHLLASQQTKFFSFKAKIFFSLGLCSDSFLTPTWDLTFYWHSNLHTKPVCVWEFLALHCMDQFLCNLTAWCNLLWGISGREKYWFTAINALFPLLLSCGSECQRH